MANMQAARELIAGYEEALEGNKTKARLRHELTSAITMAKVLADELEHARAALLAALGQPEVPAEAVVDEIAAMLVDLHTMWTALWAIEKLTDGQRDRYASEAHALALRALARSRRWYREALGEHNAPDWRPTELLPEDGYAF